MHEYIIKPVRPCKQLTCRALFGAPERTRTFTGEPPLEPESNQFYLLVMFYEHVPQFVPQFVLRFFL